MEACFDTKLKDLRLDVQNNEQGDPSFADLVQKVGGWRYMVGAMKDSMGKVIGEKQLAVEAGILLKNYPNFTLMELDNAINLLIAQKLNVKVDFINFSPLFMGQILSAYEKYKQMRLSLIPEYQAEQDETKKTTISERMQSMKEMITEIAIHVKSGGVGHFFSGIVYDFLRATKRLRIDTDLLKNSKEYANKQYGFFVKKGDKTILETANLPPEAKKEKIASLRRFQIDFLLKDFFEKNNVDKVIESMSEKEWVIPETQIKS